MEQTADKDSHDGGDTGHEDAAKNSEGCARTTVFWRAQRRLLRIHGSPFPTPRSRGAARRTNQHYRLDDHRSEREAKPIGGGRGTQADRQLPEATAQR